MRTDDWTSGPARHVAGGFVGGAALIGLVWVVVGREPRALPEPPPPVVIIRPDAAPAPHAFTPIEPARSITPVEPHAFKPQSYESETLAPVRTVRSIPFERDPGVRPDRAEPEPLALPESLPAPGRRPEVEPPSETQPKPPAKPSAVLRLNVNAATQAELETLPGIGPTYARRIIENRRARGPFRSLADLQRVKGIGPKTAKKLEPLIRFE